MLVLLKLERERFTTRSLSSSNWSRVRSTLGVVVDGVNRRFVKTNSNTLNLKCGLKLTYLFSSSHFVTALMPTLT